MILIATSMRKISNFTVNRDHGYKKGVNNGVNNCVKKLNLVIPNTK